MDDDELIQTLESLNLRPTKVEKGRFGESYFTDESTGGKYIIPSKRPDGTYRKEIKIRPGYVPPEERQLYVPLHRRTQTNQDCTPPNNSNFNESNNKLSNKEELNKTEPKKEHKTSSLGSKQTVTSGLKNNSKPPKQSKYNSRNRKPPPNNNSNPKDDKTTSEPNKNGENKNKVTNSGKKIINNG
ncbi:Mago binding family protein [Theileria parva strain Muguga]|uniref:Mago binding family protein n=1 Tax=Theileria parva strain Muguga TaxID=333668 RepID=UPI001C6240B4|nr:Mago binding family protein [Theileria parva strain Muguga]KAF5153538.1 Mago binding family protein [Theileria parva strain Muguga]